MKQGLRLVQQQNTTIKVKETPVILIEYSSSSENQESMLTGIVSAVNFLRSDCPRVQLIIDMNAYKDDPESFNALTKIIRRKLDALTCPSETFYMVITDQKEKIILVLRNAPN